MSFMGSWLGVQLQRLAFQSHSDSSTHKEGGFSWTKEGGKERNVAGLCHHTSDVDVIATFREALTPQLGRCGCDPTRTSQPRLFRI